MERDRRGPRTRENTTKIKATIDNRKNPIKRLSPMVWKKEKSQGQKGLASANPRLWGGEEGPRLRSIKLGCGSSSQANEEGNVARCEETVGGIPGLSDTAMEKIPQGGGRKKRV